jgi:hypothetical protein
MGSDPGIAGQQQFYSSLEEGLQRKECDAMRFSPAHWNVIDDICSQPAQTGNQQRGGGLPIHIEIAPHADTLCAHGLPARSGLLPLEIGQIRWRSIGCTERVKECLRLRRSADPSANQRSRQQRVLAGSLPDFWGHLYRYWGSIHCWRKTFKRQFLQSDQSQGQLW